jgi:hypothetical protein
VLMEDGFAYQAEIHTVVANRNSFVAVPARTARLRHQQYVGKAGFTTTGLDTPLERGIVEFICKCVDSRRELRVDGKRGA